MKEIEECRKLRNNIEKLSKISRPDYWKMYGRPHVALWIDSKNKKYDSFRVGWPVGIHNEISVHFSIDDAKMSIKDFKKKIS